MLGHSLHSTVVHYDAGGGVYLTISTVYTMQWINIVQPEPQATIVNMYKKNRELMPW